MGEKTHFKIVYRCNHCKKEFDPDELPDMEDFNEEGDWEYPCPDCKRPVKWGFK